MALGGPWSEVLGAVNELACRVCDSPAPALQDGLARDLHCGLEPYDLGKALRAPALSFAAMALAQWLVDVARHWILRCWR